MYMAIINKYIRLSNLVTKMSKVKKPAIILAAVLLIGAGTIAVLELTNTTHWLHAKTTVADKPTPKPRGIQPQSTAVTPSPSPATSDDNSIKVHGTTSPSKDLLAPQGTFANVYEATMDEQMSSTCTSNAGVYCKIVFIKDGVSKSLPDHLTDTSGSTAWAWKPRDIGLSPGIWHIKAVASYNGQTKTTNNDPLTLKIKS